MNNKKIIFMGTPEIATIYLKVLVEINCNIIASYSQPPRKQGRGMVLQKSPVHKYALSKNLNIFTPNNFNNEETKNKILNLKPDLIVLMGYGLKLPKYVLDLPLFGCINIHVSLLPCWRGAAPIEHALMNGDEESGITIFKLVEEMDAGPIIASKSIHLDSFINKDELTNKINLLGPKLLTSILPKKFDKKINYKNQDHGKATYAYKISTDLRKLNFYKKAEEVHNKIRAFANQPGAWFYFNNERIKIIRSSFEEGTWEPSTIINNQFHIGCNNGKICPEIIQKEGKKPMVLEDFLRGFDFIVGSKINA